MSDSTTEKIIINNHEVNVNKIPLIRMFRKDDFKQLLEEINNSNNSNNTVDILIQLFGEISIFSEMPLATIYVDIDNYKYLADFLGMKLEQLKRICKYAYDTFAEDIQKKIKQSVEDSKNVKFIPMTDTIKQAEFKGKESDSSAQTTSLVPLVDNSVDYKDYFVLAKDQGQLGSCYVFAATALREFHENRRSGRGKKVDFSESYGLWLDKNGDPYAIDTGGYYSNVLNGYSKFGTAMQDYWFYDTELIAQNYLRIPAPQDSIIDAKYFQGDSVAQINNTIDSVKDVLRQGKTMVIQTLSGFWWLSGYGVIIDYFPVQMGGAHCVLVTGFVDDPSYNGGGYFIIRNSWGNKWGELNQMGKEYGGYLKMSYYYYSNYSLYPTTFRNDLYVKTDWLVEYYPNITLSGNPKTVTTSEEINISIARRTNFSLRCSNSIYFSSGWYRFKLASDDGAKLWVDDRKVIDIWYDHPVLTKEIDYYVTEGIHTVKIEYYQKGGGNVLQFNYTLLDWTFYYSSLVPSETKTKNDISTESDTIQYFQIESDLNKMWKHIPPKTANEDGIFTLTTNRKLNFSETKDIIFYARVSGGINLYLDNTIVLAHIGDNDQEYISNPVTVTAGEHNISITFTNKNVIENHNYNAFLYVNWFDTSWSEKIYDDSAIDSLYENLSYFTTKKILSEGRVHRFRIENNYPFRLIVDGLDVLDYPKEIIYYVDDNNLGKHRAYFYVDVELTKGVHEIAIEAKYPRVGFTDLSQEMWYEQWYNDSELKYILYEGYTDKIDYNWQRKFTTLEDHHLNPLISSRQTTTLYLKRGLYRFNLTNNCNIRLYVNGKVHLDTWLSKIDFNERCDSIDVEIKGGKTEIIIESFGPRNYVLALSYYNIGYLVEYYKDMNVGKDSSNTQVSPPTLSRYEKEINFDYGLGGPSSIIGVDYYSSRWLGNIYLPVGEYEITLSVGAKDGMRLYIDERLVIDRWDSYNLSPVSAIINLTGRVHEIIYEYRHSTGQSLGKIKFNRRYYYNYKDIIK